MPELRRLFTYIKPQWRRLFALFIVQALVSFSYRYQLQYVAQRAIADLRLALHHHLLQLAWRAEFLRFSPASRNQGCCPQISSLPTGEG